MVLYTQWQTKIEPSNPVQSSDTEKGYRSLESTVQNLFFIQFQVQVKETSHWGHHKVNFFSS